MEDKVLEIGEKEDNYIVYLEAQLENLSLLEEEKKVDDEFGVDPKSLETNETLRCFFSKFYKLGFLYQL